MIVFTIISNDIKRSKTPDKDAPITAPIITGIIYFFIFIKEFNTKRNSIKEAFYINELIIKSKYMISNYLLGIVIFKLKNPLLSLGLGMLKA